MSTYKPKPISGVMREHWVIHHPDINTAFVRSGLMMDAFLATYQNMVDAVIAKRRAEYGDYPRWNTTTGKREKVSK